MARNSAILLLSAIAGLLVVGLVILSSTSVWSNEMREVEDQYQLFKRQLVWCGLGIFCAYVVSHFDYAQFGNIWPYMLGAVCLLLICCYIPGIREVNNGEGRWIKLGPLPTIQPSEFGKPIIVICLAAWFARYQAEVKNFYWGFLYPGLLLGVPSLLILFEKDLGTTMVVGCVGMAMLFVAGTRIWLLAGTVLMAVGGICLFVKGDPERLARLTAFLHMDDPAVRAADGWQQYRALLAFDGGGVLGTGLGNGAEKHGSLPFAHTDFIFAALGEELGLLFTLITVLLFVLVAIAGCGIAISARDFFGRLLAIGATLIIVVPSALNMGVVTGLLPVTGLPLPFFSYGGSCMLATLFSVGLLLSVQRRALAPLENDAPIRREHKFVVKL